MFDHPLLVLLLSLGGLGAACQFGSTVLARLRPLANESREDFVVVLTASMTLLALIIGFSFSMAINRYDQRKNLEQAEANAIGTAYTRTDLMPPADTIRAKAILKKYLDQRVLFYVARDEPQLRAIELQTSQLQDQLWSTTVAPATSDRSPVYALVVAAVNDVLNAQSNTQAAWWNRIPAAAWCLMVTIAICCNVLLGYGMRKKEGVGLRLVFPFVVSVAFFLIADLDSPRGGIIQVNAQDLGALAQALNKIKE
jgi:hypothetical protein